MGYMQIATKHVARKGLVNNKQDTVDPTAKVASAQQPVNKVAKVVKPKAVVAPINSRSITNTPAVKATAIKQPVPGTPFAALSNLMKGKK